LRIECKDQIGSGVSGTVFRGKDELDRPVAVKFFNGDLKFAKEQIQSRVKALAAIQHPNVVQVYGIEDVKRPNGTVPETAVVMELVDGVTYGDWLTKENLSPEEVQAVVEGVLNGIEEFHKFELGHGDLHGGNILVYNGVAKVIDPGANNPESLLSTQTVKAKKRVDLHQLKLLIGEALLLIDADTLGVGNWYFVESRESTIAELREHFHAAMRSRKESVRTSATLRTSSFYEFCRRAQASNNHVEWQELRKSVLRTLQPQLDAFRGDKHSLGSTRQIVEGNLHDLILGLSDLVAFILSSAESRDPAFNREFRLIPRLVGVQWATAGETHFVEVPQFLVFVLQAMFGATACANENAARAIEMGALRIPDRYARHGDEPRVLVKCSNMVGWPKSLGGECVAAHGFLTDLYALMPVLRSVFHDEHAFKTALGAHYLLASLLEAVQPPLPSDAFFPRTVPAMYMKLSDGQYEEACAMLFRFQTGREMLLRAGKVDEAKLDEIWGQLVTYAAKLNTDAYGFPVALPVGMMKLPWRD